ncbi:MAG: hypothetical protein AB7O62_09930 [Pirellulales bacterium]
MPRSMCASLFSLALALSLDQELLAQEELAAKTHDVAKVAAGAAEQESLIKAIVHCIQPASWEDVGGKATIALRAKGKIDVLQTAAAQQEIASLLAALGKLRAIKPGTKPGKPRAAAKVKPADPDKPMRVVVYDVYDLVHKQNFDDYESLIRELTENISPDTWDEVGGQGKISVFSHRGALIVSQTAEVHKSVGEKLAELRKK